MNCKFRTKQVNKIYPHICTKKSSAIYLTNCEDRRHKYCQDKVGPFFGELKLFIKRMTEE